MSSSPLTITPLGSGKEVGRSCHLLQFKNKQILLDCGIHPGRRGLETLPYLDLIPDISKIDLLLISHFHLDHVGALPYLLQKTKFKGRVFCTHPTLAVTKLLLLDYVRVTGVAQDGSGSLYSDEDVLMAVKKCEKIDFHQQIQVDGIKFTAYNAGHVLGACQFLIEIDAVRVLYTGDFSREDDRHLMGAECNPEWHPDVLIVESTFGVQVHESQRERERQFVDAIDRITKRGGKCLIPVFSLGRAQELLLILEEHWGNNPEIQQIPIYHASRLAAMSLSIYRRFINSMNARIRKQNDISNPWELQHISNLENPQDFDELGPAVVLASPGMLQNGTSRKLFEAWCTDPRNGVVIAGYCVEGTLAKEILKEPKEITALSGRRLPLNCEVKYISFTAHSDFPGTYSYIKQLLPRHTVFVHGEETEMKRLYDELGRKFQHERELKEMDFFMPANGVKETFYFKEEHIVKMLGRLADKRARFENAPVNGFLVTSSLRFDDVLVAPDELQAFTQLATTVLAQRLHVPFHSRFERLKNFVGKLFEVEVVVNDAAVGGAAGGSSSAAASASSNRIQRNSLKVLDEILLTHSYPPGEVLIEWRASPANDMVADAVVALLMQAEGGVSGVRISSCFHRHKHHHHGHAHGGGGDGKTEDDAAEDGSGGGNNRNNANKEDSDDEDDDEREDGPRTMDQVATLVKVLLEERFGEHAVKTTNDGDGTESIVLETEDGKMHVVSVLDLICISQDTDVKKTIDKCILNAKRALMPIGVQLHDVAEDEIIEDDAAFRPDDDGGVKR